MFKKNKAEYQIQSKTAQRLYDARKSLNLTQQQVQDKTGIACAHVSKIELGTVMPNAFTLINFADLYGVSVDYLLGRIEN